LKKNYIALALGSLLSLTLMVAPVHADTIQNSVAVIQESGYPYAPVNTIVQKMGGTVQRNDTDKFTTFTINGKNVRIDDTWSFAVVDGNYIPYETRTLGGFTIPVFSKPIIQNGNVYVPVDFLKSSVGLQLSVTGNTVTFNAVGDGNSTAKVATVTKPSTGGTQSSSKGGSENIESNRPIPQPTPTSNTNTTPVATPNPQPTHAPVYNGNEIKQKLYSLGFVDIRGGLTLNPYGSQGAAQFSSMDFSAQSGNIDMNLTIYQSTPEIDQKIQTILNWILPTQGNTLYSILNNSNCSSQTIELDGRTISIDDENRFISICFGPTT
jgi:hypothetical protein